MTSPVTRRQVLAGGAGAAIAAAVGSALPSRAWASPAPGPAVSHGAGASPVLVVVSLYGGNDGLNMVIPFDPAYMAARPTLGYKPTEALSISSEFGLHPNMAGLANAFASGTLAIVQGVCYPAPDHSHTSSMTKWQSGDPTGTDPSGWLGRVLDQLGDPTLGISIGSNLPLILSGRSIRGLCVPSGGLSVPLDRNAANAYAYMAAAGGRPGVLGSIGGTDNQLVGASGEIARILGSAPKVSVAGGSLGGQLAVVSRLIQGGAPTLMYEVSLGGFDTHVNEKNNHAALMGDLDRALTGFMASLGPARSRVVAMTYSEFGRRVAQNASSGTDHGTSAPVLVLGDRVIGGFYGQAPSLSNLDSGDLAVTTDYRQVYATAIGSHLGIDPAPALGGHFDDLGLIGAKPPAAS